MRLQGSRLGERQGCKVKPPHNLKTSQPYKYTYAHANILKPYCIKI